MWPAQRLLTRDGEAVELGATALDLLLHLMTQAGRPVSKDALITAVWAGRRIESNNLTVRISPLRRVLARAAGGTNFIRTLPGKGYIFTADVTSLREPLPVGAVARPAQFATPFVGRQRELDELAALLREQRLVTLTGLGGIGKTRLALQLASIVAPEFADGTRIVDLAPLAEPKRLAELIATGVGAGAVLAPPNDALVAALRPLRVLLILDNAEHLRGAVVPLLQQVLSECPGVAVLVTSRVNLALLGEKVFRLLPLPTPETGAALTAAEALRFDSVHLLVDRATALIPGFDVERAGPSVLAEICCRLDGIALAIEMVVPRLQVLTAAQLLELLHQRLHLLAPRLPDALPRQRTLRTMFDWSWERLPAEAREVLQQLAVFSGSAGLDALLAIGNAGEQGRWDVLDALTAVVEASLAVAETGGPQPRYRLLETTRQYALERLPAGAEAALRRRHAIRTTEAFEQAEAEWPTASSTAWQQRYGPDADNLRAALDWAFAPGGDQVLGLRLVAASYPLWWDLPGLPLRESRRWFDLAVTQIGPQTPLPVQARLWLGHSWRDVQNGDIHNIASAERAAALFRALDEPMGLGAALWRVGSATLIHDRYEHAYDILRESERVLRTQPTSKWLALCLIRQADVLAHPGLLEESLPLYEEALGMVHASGHWYGQMLVSSNLAEALFRLGRRDEAVAHMLRNPISLVHIRLR